MLDPGSDAAPNPAGSAPRFPITLLVARVSSSQLYRDDRLVYGTGPVQLGTYEYERWAESPAEMVQDTLIASLRSTGEYRSVSAIGSNLRGEYILRGHLYALDEVDKPGNLGALFDRTGTFRSKDRCNRLDRHLRSR